MRRLVFEIKKDNEISHMEFITDRTPGWTVQQYLRNRPGLDMTLISNETVWKLHQRFGFKKYISSIKIQHYYK